MRYIDDNGEKYVRNIIYQYWQGDLKPGVKYSTKLIKEYANRIGAEYRFDHNIQIASKTVNVPIYYEPANPLVDPSFDEYDNVALIDIDVYPVEGLTENLFHLDGEDAGICTEPKQPHFRQIYDVAGITNQNDKRWCELLKRKWGIEYSFDSKERPMVYNTGVVVISKAGLQKMKTTWPSFQEYVNEMSGFPRFYRLFQDYFSAMIHMPGFNFKAMDNGWNCYMHKVGSHPNAQIGDNRGYGGNAPKLVHVMFRTADDWPVSAINDVVNKPIREWNLPVHKEWPNDAEKTSNTLLTELNRIYA